MLSCLLRAQNDPKRSSLSSEHCRGDCRDRIAVLARLPSAGCQEFLGRVSSSQPGAAFLQGCMHWECKGSGQEKAEHTARNCNEYRK